MSTAKNQNTNPNKNYPNTLWTYRKKRGLSQKQVAYLMGHKSTAHISNYERGKKLPTLENALKLELILSAMVNFLFPQLHDRIRQEIHARRIASSRFRSLP